MKNKILLALKAHYEALAAKNEALLENYLQNSAGIGEHPDIVEAMEVQIEKIANAEEKIATIQKHFSR